MTIITEAISEVLMGSITIRNIDDALKRKLRLRAAHRNRSMGEEARDILRTALAEDSVPMGNLAQAIRKRIDPLGGVELSLPSRNPMDEPIDFT
jgi:plasmid stability protein